MSTPQIPSDLGSISTLSNPSITDLAKVARLLEQNNITMDDAIARYGSEMPCNIAMAKLIDARDAAYQVARKDDTISDGQRNSLKAHRALALHRGDAALANDINALLRNFNATFGMAHLALDICVDTQGKPAAQFFPRRDNSSTGAVSPARSVDAGILPNEAV